MKRPFVLLCQFGCGRPIAISKEDVLALKRGENLVCVCCFCANKLWAEVTQMFSGSIPQYIN